MSNNTVLQNLYIIGSFSVNNKTVTQAINDPVSYETIQQLATSEVALTSPKIDVCYLNLTVSFICAKAFARFMLTYVLRKDAERKARKKS